MKGTTRAIAVACLAVVVLGHALILWWWRPTVSPSTRPPPHRMVLRWMPSAPRASTASTPSTTRPEQPARPSPSRSPMPTLTGAASESRAEAPTPSRATAAAAVDESASPAARRPLDLTVRIPPRATEPATAAALADPRSNGQRASLGDVIARRIGADDRRYEEVRADGSVRIRQGASCLDARASRAAELDPFRGAERPAPRQLSQCN